MNVLVQLNPPLGAGVGPNFNLTANVGTVIPSTATAAQLLAGIIAIVSNTATILNIVPNGGACPTTISLNLPPLPTTTTSTSTTTIAPLCQCMLLYNTNADYGITVQYRNCSGQLVGISINANESIQVCGSDPATQPGLDITLGGPCASSQAGYVCTACAAEKCGTYLIVNGGPADYTFQYIDCTGASVTATVPGAIEGTDGEINICSCNEITFPKGYIASYLVSTDCVLCKCYKIYNPTQGTLNYTWTDCEKFAPNVEPILAGQVQYMCSMSNGFIPDPGLIITNTENYCTVLIPQKGGGGIEGPVKGKTGIGVSANPSTRPCREPDLYCYTVTITGTAQFEYVTFNGILENDGGTDTTLYVCAWEDSIIKTSGTGTITAVTSYYNCSYNWQCEPCFCYTAYNTSGVDQVLEWADCTNNGSTTVVIIPNNNSFAYCGRYPISGYKDLTIIKGNSCSIGEACEAITTTTTIAPTTTTTSSSTTTTTTLLLKCYRFANSTQAAIIVTVYDITGFPTYISVPALSSNTYTCGVNWDPITGITGANLGACSATPQCGGSIPTTTTTTTVACDCYLLSSLECSYFSYTDCDGVFVPSLQVCVTPTKICGSNVQDLGNIGTITPLGQCDNTGTCPPTQRCTVSGINNYGQMERGWYEPEYIFTIVDFTLNGVNYAAGQSITINPPGDLVVGTSSIDGGTYVMNINDWLNSVLLAIFGSSRGGWYFYDNMTTIDKPNAASTFNITINSNIIGYNFGNYYWKSTGGGSTTFSIQNPTHIDGVYSCTLLNPGIA